ncbi:hypothetical protein SLA2020_084500 [Shorea laevis]
MEYQKDYHRRIGHEGLEIIDAFYPPPSPPRHDPDTEAFLIIRRTEVESWNLAQRSRRNPPPTPPPTPTTPPPTPTPYPSRRMIRTQKQGSVLSWRGLRLLLKSHESKPQVSEHSDEQK